MTIVYAKLDGKLASWEVDTEDTNLAILSVKAQLPDGFAGAVLAVAK